MSCAAGRKIHDTISRNRMVTRYSYHHGFYDGLEREFRGFGRVDQLDTEDFATFQEAGGPPAENWDIESNVPPVLTKTWFHTGVYLAGGRISRHMEHEYFAEPDAPVRLADTVLPRGLTPFEAREACRALKGEMLRQEVYGLDGSDRANVPYRVLDSNSSIQPLQPKADNRYAVFFTHPREAITLNFERNATDPRINHKVALKVDDYGNVLRSVAIGYQRRAPEFDEQGTALATLTENVVTNAVWAPDAWRTPLPAETRTYQLTAPALRGAEPLPFALLETLAQAATPIPYEAAPTAGAENKRLIEHVRTLYRADDLSRLLPFGMAEALALPGEGYKQALTEGLLAIFAAKAGPAEIRRILANPDAAYRDLDGDGPFWLPSGRVYYSGEVMAPADELREALRDFFLPRRFRDPFGHSTLVGYDEHRLAQVFTCDAVGNETRATLDYRVMQPHRLTDPNGNRSEARFDALGMLVGTALHGKPDNAEEGDSFDDFIVDLPTEAVKAYFDTADPAASAIAHLGTATTRILYDLERVPVCAATIARERHVPARWHKRRTDPACSCRLHLFRRFRPDRPEEEPRPSLGASIPATKPRPGPCLAGSGPAPWSTTTRASRCGNTSRSSHRRRVSESSVGASATCCSTIRSNASLPRCCPITLTRRPCSTRGVRSAMTATTRCCRSQNPIPTWAPISGCCRNPTICRPGIRSVSTAPWGHMSGRRLKRPRAMRIRQPQSILTRLDEPFLASPIMAGMKSARRGFTKPAPFSTSKAIGAP